LCRQKEDGGRAGEHGEPKADEVNKAGCILADAGKNMQKQTRARALMQRGGARKKRKAGSKDGDKKKRK